MQLIGSQLVKLIVASHSTVEDVEAMVVFRPLWFAFYRFWLSLRAVAMGVVLVWRICCVAVSRRVLFGHLVVFCFFYGCVSLGFGSQLYAFVGFLCWVF